MCQFLLLGCLITWLCKTRLHHPIGTNSVPDTKKTFSLWLGGLLLFFHKIITEQRNCGPPVHLFVSFLQSCTIADSSILVNLESTRATSCSVPYSSFVFSFSFQADGIKEALPTHTQRFKAIPVRNSGFSNSFCYVLLFLRVTLCHPHPFHCCG